MLRNTAQAGSALALTFALFVAAAGCQDLKPSKGKGPGAASSAVVASGPKVKLEFYVMSKCPFGSQVEKSIAPVLEELGPYVDFHLEFIADEKDGSFTSMHGESEVQGNIIQLCAVKHYPQTSQYMSFINCQNERMRSIPKNWESCATKNGLDVAKLKACYEGEEGKQLLRDSIARKEKRGARGSPTIFLADKRYQGGRGKSDFMRAICGEIKGQKPEPCSKIPEPVEVKAIVLTDKRCKKCAHQGLEANLRSRFFPKLTVRPIDYSSEEGKSLFKKLELKRLPAWLFEDNVKQAEKYDNIKRWMAKRGEYMQLKVPATFDPTAEICDNKIDDTGNGKVDCEDDTCKQALVCRDEKKEQVDVFVMSQCPYGVRALNSMKEVLDNFKGKLKFDVHYIADEKDGTETGFSALHGQPEVRENIRQLCAKKYYSRNNKYLDYIWCRNKNYRSEEWESCAKGGISASKIEKCATGDEGKELLRDDIKIAKALDISGSPTWLANNRFKFSGIAADAIKKNVCKHNPKMANCDKKLTEKAEVSGSCN
jgi:glutaredoxin